MGNENKKNNPFPSGMAGDGINTPSPSEMSGERILIITTRQEVLHKAKVKVTEEQAFILTRVNGKHVIEGTEEHHLLDQLLCTTDIVHISPPLVTVSKK